MNTILMYVLGDHPRDYNSAIRQEVS